MGSTETAIDAESHTKSIRTDDNESQHVKSEEEEPMSPKFDITVKSENLTRTPENKKNTDIERIDSKIT